MAEDTEAEEGQHLICLLFRLFWIGLIVDLIKNGIGERRREEEEEVRREERNAAGWYTRPTEQNG